MLRATEMGITNSSSPNESITREQAATMLYRYAVYVGMDIGETEQLSTRITVSPWAYDAMSWAVTEGIFGDEEPVLPQALLSQEEAMRILDIIRDMRS